MSSSNYWTPAENTTGVTSIKILFFVFSAPLREQILYIYCGRHMCPIILRNNVMVGSM